MSGDVLAVIIAAFYAAAYVFGYAHGREGRFEEWTRRKPWRP